MMNFDDYFESNENDLVLDDNTITCLEAMEAAILKSGLQPNRATSHVHDMLMKPLPPIPEEIQESRWMAPKQDDGAIDNRNVTSTRLQRNPALRYPSEKPRPLFHAMPSATAQASQHTSNLPDTAVCLATLNNGSHVSSEPSFNTNKLTKPFQSRQTDVTFDEFDSVDLRESSDLDRWANEIYGRQNNTMSSSRQRHYESSVGNTSGSCTAMSEATGSLCDESTWSSIYRLSAYSSSHESNDHSDSNGLREDPTRHGPSGDIMPVSAFDFSDDESDPLIEDCQRSKALQHRRVKSAPAVRSNTMRHGVETQIAHLEELPGKSAPTSRFSATQTLRLLSPLKFIRKRRDLQPVPAAVSSPKARKILGLKNTCESRFDDSELTTAMIKLVLAIIHRSIIHLTSIHFNSPRIIKLPTAQLMVI
jgi:hypothetical protein